MLLQGLTTETIKAVHWDRAVGVTIGGAHVVVS